MIKVKILTVHKVTIDGGKARLRVDVELNALEAETGKPASGFGLRKRVINCARENGGWRVWSEDSAFENLAKRLLAAPTEKDRDSLLVDEKDLLSPQLIDEGNRQGGRGFYPEALITFRVAQGVAEKINDSRGLGQALNNIGLVYLYMEKYSLALERPQKSPRIAEENGN
jgi:hypothetical protein